MCRWYLLFSSEEASWQSPKEAVPISPDIERGVAVQDDWLKLLENLSCLSVCWARIWRGHNRWQFHLVCTQEQMFSTQDILKTGAVDCILNLFACSCKVVGHWIRVACEGTGTAQEVQSWGIPLPHQVLVHGNTLSETGFHTFYEVKGIHILYKFKTLWIVIVLLTFFFIHALKLLTRFHC